MNILLLHLLFILLTPPVAIASDNLGPYKPATVSYWLYGGGLGDPIPPKANDKKIAFSIEGEAAQQIFDAIGPDKHDACTEGSGTRFRARDNENLSCTRSKDGDYVCNFGFDLVTGKSIGGSIC
ncbi:hypothetical protein SOM61_06185 [Massilia sp. CFBP9012]|uniref:hypothetical protein n=1 Tax=Massilia sp. CFBP9012 TaxID=3096531 RepID=UPI002A6AFA0B|nr:hypothetical protein [Massilia sp. CFBP9012]MDY0974543.1 hypothetical protein [Massilia sp. CFBP9012]